MVIILRGIPGSGKSTWTRENAPGAVVCSADHFFEVSGEYKFDPRQLPAAHGACIRKFVGAVSDPRNTVVVDNTSTSVAEVSPYASLALAYGHDLRIVTLRVDPETAHARNVHGVGIEGIRAMARRLEESTGQLPPWWPEEVISG
jgi:predicted kinase